MNVDIAPMERRHIRAVLALDDEVYATGWSRQMFLNELAAPATRFHVVAGIGGVVVGHAGLLFAVDDAHVTTVAVDPQQQGNRIGTRLMIVLAREARRRGSQAMTLEVRSGNDAAQALYRRFGFAPAGVRRGYYQEDGEDALIMWAHEIAEPGYHDRLDEIEAALTDPTTLHPTIARSAAA